MNQSRPIIQCEGVTKSFGAHKALEAVSLRINRGEFFSLLGPSGCGKTTLLKIIAGLDFPNSGRLEIAGKDMADIPAHLRNVHTVFQSYALFPHLNVFDNIAFGLRMKKIPNAEIRARVDKMLQLFEIESLKDRRPDALSGGQKQRVALARAVVNEPELLLLDEPMAALDAQLRRQLQKELRALQARLGMTFIYVTHDQEEALTMSSRMAVMNQGRVEQVGTPAEVYEFPRTRFVASFLGAANIFEIKSRTADAVETEVGKFEISRVLAREREPSPQPSPIGWEREQEGGRSGMAGKYISIRPEKVQLVTCSGSSSHLGPIAIIKEASYTGAERHYLLETQGVAIRAHRPSGETPLFQPGDKALLHIQPQDIRFLED